MLHRIMIIDDDEDDRDFFSYAIREIDPSIQIIFCKSGTEALNLLQEATTGMPQLIFLDINMPGIDGRQTLVRLRQIKTLEHLPIIIYSTSGVGAADMLAMGASHVMVKPYRLKTVVDELRQLLDLYRR